jgi:hypothetical protein
MVDAERERQERMNRSTLTALVVVASLATGTAAPTRPDRFAPDRAQLLAGVETLIAPGSPGGVRAFGSNAFTVVDGTNGVPVMVASKAQRGRVVAFGHNAFLSDGTYSEENAQRVLANVLGWLGNEHTRAACVQIGAHLDARIAAAGMVALPRAELAKADVIVWDTHTTLSDAEAALVLQKVNVGAGLLCAATGWGWMQIADAESLARDFTSNRVLANLGVAVTDEFADPDDHGGFHVARGPKTASADEAFAALDAKTLDEERREFCANTLDALLRCVPADEPTRIAPLRKRLESKLTRFLGATADEVPQTTLEDRLLVRFATERFEVSPPAEVRSAPTHALFPGRVDAAAPRLNVDVAIHASTSGWHALGLYAPPGEVVRVTLAADVPLDGLSLRIGCHTDENWHHARWDRWPRIAMARPFEAPTLEVASPHGGLLYLDVDRSRAGATIDVHVEGAIAAPRFVRGITTREQWAALANQPMAPWGELEGEHVVLALPWSTLKDVADPEAVTRFWDEVWTAHVELLGEPISPLKERLVPDAQISAGYMHSGYPIMTFMDVVPLVVDLAKLKAEGSWGHFHELGHNAQRDEWTWDATVEVTCNLFTLHAMEKVCGIPVAKHPNVVETMPRATALKAKGGDARAWSDDPFLALMTYVELQQRFGWEPFTRVFQEYERQGRRGRPRSDQEKIDQFVERFSRAVGVDVSPLWIAYGLSVDPAVVKRLADLPQWK